jgi:hypothetical protein
MFENMDKTYDKLQEFPTERSLSVSPNLKMSLRKDQIPLLTKS